MWFSDRGQGGLCEMSRVRPQAALHRDQLVQRGSLDAGGVQRQLRYPGLVEVVDFRLETCGHEGQCSGCH